MAQREIFGEFCPSTTERSRELQPIAAVPEKPVRTPAIPTSARVAEIVQKISLIWRENPKTHMGYSYRLVHGQPLILRGEAEEEIGRGRIRSIGSGLDYL